MTTDLPEGLSEMLTQTAVWWAAPTRSADGGHIFGTAPVEIGVRWQDQAERFLDVHGEEQTSGSVVYPDRALAVGDWLFLGTLADLSSGEESNPQTVKSARPIRGRSASPDGEGATFVRKVWL